MGATGTGIAAIERDSDGCIVPAAVGVVRGGGGIGIDDDAGRGGVAGAVPGDVSGFDADIPGAVGEGDRVGVSIRGTGRRGDIGTERLILRPLEGVGRSGETRTTISRGAPGPGRVVVGGGTGRGGGCPGDGRIGRINLHLIAGGLHGFGIADAVHGEILEGVSAFRAQGDTCSFT